MSSRTITIVTSNTSKFKEMSEALSHHGIEAQRVDFDIDEIKEIDIERVVKDKVMKAFEKVAGPVVVDDSGIFFDKYNQFPGTYSKYLYKTIGFDGIFKLVEPGDTAVFRTYVAYMDEERAEPEIFQGEYPGKIDDQFDQSKDYEMPYAPMFIPEGEDKDMASMTPAERANDHRHQALNKFAEWFVAQG
ncbi:non-canonical purine NTP pyrophosphatase [Patescibacteria group bacterium]